MPQVARVRLHVNLTVLALLASTLLASTLLTT